MKRPSAPLVAIVFAALLGALLSYTFPAFAQPELSIRPITWNVIGLDSNDVNVGPNNFPVGARVCNEGTQPALNVTSTFIWDSSDPYIALRPSSLSQFTGSNAVASLAAGSCHDFYYEVQVTRNSAAYNHTRRYHITATADTLGTVSTATPRELFVERLISQNRNSTTAVQLDGVSIPPGGTMALFVGSTYNITLVGSTATNGYEQIETFINFLNTIFRVNSVASTYSADGGTDPDAATKLYADGCDWENDPNSPNYRSCLSTGKYGGNVTVDYNITILSGAGTTQTLNTLIYDFSGSSYHYNSDYGVGARIVQIIDPANVSIAKSFAPNPTNVGGVSTLSFTITNPNSVPVSDLNFSDTFPSSPGAMVVANPTGASTSGCGTPTFAPVAGAGSISFADGTVAANGSCIIRVNVTVPEVGTYDNTSENLFVGTTDTGDDASDSLIVNDEPTPPDPVCGLTMAQWTFTGISNPPPQPSPSTQAPDVSTAAISVGGTVPGSLFDIADGASGSPAAPSLLLYGWPGNVTLNPATHPFIQLAIDTSNYTQVQLTLNAERKAPGPSTSYLYYSTDGMTWNSKATFNTTTSWAGYGPYDFTGQTSTTGVTYFRLYGTGANNPNQGADLSIDQVTFTGCGTPNPPTISKSFSPDPVAVGGTSSLTFTISNANATVALSGIQFSDTLPAGVTVSTGSATACGGTLSRTAPDSISFSGGSLAAGASCNMSVTVTVTTAGPHNNVSGFITATQSGPNTTPSGSASDSITAISPPTIAKLFAPNPILTGGVSTLAFAITNPNPDFGLTGVQFSDTFPTSPGAMVVASPTGASATNCGTPTYAPAAGAGSITFSGGSIAAGGTCTVRVNVTAVTTGTYDNTSGAVSATTVGGTDTASDSLLVQPVHPGVTVLKQVSTSAAGPWTTFVAVSAGSDVYYRFTVENTGDVELTNVNVTDPTLSGLGVVLSGCVWPSMPLYDLQTCVVGPVTAQSGSHSNTGTAHGTYGGTVYSSASSTATYATTGLTLVKSVLQSFFTAAGNVLDYRYQVTNSGSAPLAGPVTIDDDLASDESCPDLTTVGDGDAFLETGESITCSASYTVTAGDVTAGSVTNTATAMVDGVDSNQDSATIYVNLPELTVSKANDVGGSATVGVAFNWALTVPNLGPVAATFNSGETIVSDPLPAGPTYGTPTPGDFTDITNSANISCSIVTNLLTCSASGADVTLGAVTGSFTVTFSVTPAAAGSLANTATVDPNTEILEADETNNTGLDTVTVVAPPTADPPAIAKAFTPDPIALGGTSTLGFTLSNPNDVQDLTGVAFSDTLPAGVTVVGLVSSNCGGTLTLLSISIDLAGGTITALGDCVISVTVTGTTAGVKVNTTGTVTSSNGGDGNTASDTLTVIGPPAIAKAFSPASILVGGTSTLQFTLTNPNAGQDLTGVAFTDTLPSGVTVASSTSTQCTTGTLTLTAADSINLSGATIPAGGSCGFSVTVTGATIGAKLNTTGTVTSSNGGDGNTASATLTVIGPPSISKAFSPDTIAQGNTSSLEFTLTNPNASVALTGVAFSDTLPAGVTVASATSSECGGTLTLTAPDSIALGGATIDPSGSCEFSVTVTSATAGTKINTTGAVTSTNGGSGNAASDTLTVNEPLVGDPALTKAVDPASAAVGDTVTFTLVVSNPGPGSADVVVTDDVPAFLDIIDVAIDPPGITPDITGNTITIDFGVMAAGDEYTVTIITEVNDLGQPPGGTNQAGLVTNSVGDDPDNNSDSVTLTIVEPSARGAPATGFAPGRRTDVPAQPEADTYRAFGELRLEIPALGVELEILGIPQSPDGWDVAWLADQAGYLAGTAFPGWSGNSVITGHATLPSGTEGPFAKLGGLRFGDQIIVSAFGMGYVYEVREHELLRPRDPSIFRHEERSWVTLLTCADYDEQSESYRLRRVVRAVLTQVEPADSMARDASG